MYARIFVAMLVLSCPAYGEVTLVEVNHAANAHLDWWYPSHHLFDGNGYLTDYMDGTYSDNRSVAAENVGSANASYTLTVNSANGVFSGTTAASTEASPPSGGGVWAFADSRISVAFDVSSAFRYSFEASGFTGIANTDYNYTFAGLYQRQGDGYLTISEYYAWDGWRIVPQDAIMPPGSYKVAAGINNRFQPNNIVDATVEFDLRIEPVLCSVDPLTRFNPEHGAAIPVSPDEVFFEHLEEPFKTDLRTVADTIRAKDGTFVPHSGRRTPERQTHLWEIGDRYRKLIASVDGIIPIGESNQLQIDPSLNPPRPTALDCQELMNQINNEVRDHGLSRAVVSNPNGIFTAQQSKHVKGLAADVTIAWPSNYTQEDINTLLRTHGVKQGRSESGEGHHFESTRSPSARGAIISGRSPINLLVEDPQGRRIGFDYLTGQEINEIGIYASYSGAGSEPQEIVIGPDEVLPGAYRIQGIGTGDGPYTIDMQTFGEDDPGVLAESVIASGTATNGELLPTETTHLFSLAGDANLDGTVNQTDAAIVASHFGSSNAFWQDGDFDFDGAVTLADLALLQSKFGAVDGSASPSVAAVPEPSSVVLCALALLGCVAIRRASRAVFS